MTHITLSPVHVAEPRRATLQADVDKFLATGGEIRQFPPDHTAQFRGVDAPGAAMRRHIKFETDRQTSGGSDAEV